MRNGYSMLMREHVEAKDLDHGDCADFQVVCPCCHEAVFKVGHHTAPDEGLAGRRYLAHYRASKSDVPECERRVAGMSNASLEQANAIGRGQSLDVFVAVFREKLMSSAAKDAKDLQSIKSQLNFMASRPAYTKLISVFRSKMQGEDNIYNEAMWDSIDTCEYSHGISPFWVKRQKSYAQGFMDHLLSASGERSFNTALSVGLLNHMAMKNALENTTEYTNEENSFIKWFINDKNINLIKNLEILHRRIGIDELNGLTDAVFLKSLSLSLMYFPYIDVLREAANKQAPALDAPAVPMRKAHRQTM